MTEGKKDDYLPNEIGMFATSAQGEGSIEGTVADYVVATPFSTVFKFERFELSKAAPRDTAQLHLSSQPRVQARSLKGFSAAYSMSGGRRLTQCTPTAAPTPAPTRVSDAVCCAANPSKTWANDCNDGSAKAV